MQKYLILLQALIALLQCWQPRATNTASAQSAGSAGARVDAANVSSADILLQQKHVSEDGSDFERLLTQRLQQEAAAGVAPAERLLSRKRRYLIFPEGSSFQLVYDGIYGIVDYTNYLILGITVALAWELPSKPQSEVIEQIADRLRDGSLGRRRNDSASKIVYVDTKKKPTTGRPTYISLAAGNTAATKAAGNTAATKAAYNYYYTNNNRRLLPLFQPPMHKKYYYYNSNNNNNNHNIGAYKRPIDSYYRQPPASTAAKYGDYRERPGDWRRKDGHYYYHYTPKAHPFAKWTQRRPPYGYTPKLTAATAGGNAGNNVKYPWWNLASRLSSSLRKKPIPARRIDSATSQQQQQQQQRHQQQQQQQHSTSGYYHQQPRLTTTTAATRKHRIYPVFGKRSIPDATPHRTHTGTNTTASMQQQQQQQQRQHRRQRRSGIARPEPELSPIERIHIRHHRSTRQSLYEKIEKYLDKLGIAHSHQCVLRALCETGQKSAERTPGTFVGELMRAVFTLPEALDEDVLAQRVHYKDQRYDAANAFSGDCAARFDLCKGSLWQSQFVA